MRIENSFIPVEGIGETTERNLWAAGVTHWDAFDPSDRPPGIGATRAGRVESFLADARERLDDGDAEFFDRTFPGGERWRLYENFREDACFFDIETTGLDERYHDVTTVSFHRGGETTTLVRGRDLTADRIREEFERSSILVSFNGARFDVPFLEANFDLSVETPHLDVMYPCRRAGLTGGLSAVEDALGVDRELPDVGGEEAVRLWHAHRRGEAGALDRLVRYNREDAANLRPVADRVADRLHREVFESARED